MEVNYKYWQAGKGYEKEQAGIYKNNNPNIGFEVKATDIVSRYEREKIDPKTVRYAFDDQGKMIAYIQARDYPQPKETHIGYPWALKGCPESVQHKLFDEMLEYLKTRKGGYPVRINVGASNEKVLSFIKNKNLELISESYRFYLDIKKIAKKRSPDNGYSTRKGNKNYLDKLVDLLKADGRFSGQFSSEEDYKDYFVNRVFPDGRVILVFKGEKLVSAGAPLVYKLPTEKTETIILRFHSYLPGEEVSFENLLIAIAKDCVKDNYGLDKKMSLFPQANENTFIEICEEFSNEKEIAVYTFGLEEKR
ncbi:MAG: hypothetical protein ACTSW1_18540 [Candidatus Hodarchaeales archaeon]